MLGASAAALALVRAMARAGVDVTLVVPDVHDAARLGETLAPVRVVMAADGRFDMAVLADAALAGGACAPVVIGLDGITPRDGGPRLHLAAPAHLRHLVEVTPGTDTAQNHMAKALIARLHGVAVTLANGAPSLLARFEACLDRTLHGLLMTGAAPFELDECLANAGFDPAPLLAQDLAGCDIGYARRKTTGDTTCFAFDRMVEEGRLGQMVGVGWYRYPGGGGPVEDPLVEDLLAEEARFAGITQRPVDCTEIRETVFTALRDESRAVVADGIADAAQVAQVVRHGLGVTQPL
ncbi:MAG: 3-hydroxyacyl-CoA dehydrogenase family protein [Pseudomonadota bacterium]|nr:3-hydroxyacyl-CoA dehydrogenase family protein [Pseudomonadota bacterium]